MKRDSIKENFIFQLVYQFALFILPLITSPIVTRALGDTGLGNYAYINSIAYYFLIVCNLGIAKYGQRLIASNREDDTKLRKSFWSLFATHSAVSLLSITAYIFFVSLFVKDNVNIYWLNLLYIASAMFDVTWLFYGLENFKSVALKNLAIRIVCFIFILIFVKTKSDLWIYALVQFGSILLGNLALFPFVFKNIKPVKFSFKECLVHLKPMLVLFVSVLAVTLYTVFDKTLLGILTTKENVAYYEYANKIIDIPKAFIVIIGTVMFPKACAAANRSDIITQKKYANYSYMMVAFIAFGSIFGLLGIGKLFAEVYYGRDFIESGNVILMLCPIILTVGLGDVVRSLFLIPQKKDTIYVISICLNAALNLLLSYLLIPVIGIGGAVVGTIAADAFGLIFQSIVCRKYIEFKNVFKPIFIYLVCGVLAFGIMRTVDVIAAPKQIILLIKFFVGFLSYTILSGVLTVFFFPELSGKILVSAKRKK